MLSDNTDAEKILQKFQSSTNSSVKRRLAQAPFGGDVSLLDELQSSEFLRGVERASECRAPRQRGFIGTVAAK